MVESMPVRVNPVMATQASGIEIANMIDQVGCIVG